ncbi:MAG: VOC family protein [Actinophytocola sp.]|uniref:VOC family protein n=1 Tax=Actinophytocola sp. TaxID=1872138 RepID=UPI003C720753
MSEVNERQPLGTPTWLDLRVPGVAELAKAKDYYGGVFGWTFADGELGTMCLLRGVPVAGMRTGDGGWTVHLATDDCDTTAKAVVAAGGTIVEQPHDVGDLGRAALATDPTGAVFGLWQGGTFPGCRLVNEPDTLVRNDLVTGDPGKAREFYPAVFGFTLDRNPDLPGFDFTFLRRQDGHEVGGIMGMPGAKSAWGTCFEVADTDATLAKAGGGTVDDTPYGRSAVFRDPFSVELSIIARP